MNTPTIHSASEAGISHQAISKNALKVVRELQQGGYQAYLVGGCVRDLLLDLKPKDFDVATDATPEQVKKLIKKSRIIGRRFRLVHVRFGYEVIEVATFRAHADDRDEVGAHEMKEGEDGQLLRDNVYGSIEEDVQRRDFRANALYYDPVSDEVLDFFNGIEDIKERKLISIGEPEQRFREDPVRMLRVVRFAAKLGFIMEPQALRMIEDEGRLLSNVSAARLFEEVLKLFHGGAAFDTYQMLREYGLFKYLFPFTDACADEVEDGMPERALKNTDKRIHEGKPVIPAFLFACMLWDPVKADAHTLMSSGSSDAQAWRIAMNDALRDQNQYVAVPRRLAEIILDIWNIHFRLIKRNPVMIKACLNNRRFRAAYDFLLLRSALHEVEPEIADWWTEIQTQDEKQRADMVSELAKSYKSRRKPRHANGETNGNSVNYTQRRNNARHGQANGRGRNGAKGRHRQQKGQRRNNAGNNDNFGNRANANADNFGNGYDQGYGNGNGGNSYANNNANRGNGGGQRRRNAKSSYGTRSGSSGGFSNPRPKDEYGHHSASGGGDQDIKKVKVRRKRRVVNSKNDTDSNPHF